MAQWNKKRTLFDGAGLTVLAGLLFLLVTGACSRLQNHHPPRPSVQASVKRWVARAAAVAKKEHGGNLGMRADRQDSMAKEATEGKSCCVGN